MSCDEEEEDPYLQSIYEEMRLDMEAEMERDMFGMRNEQEYNKDGHNNKPSNKNVLKNTQNVQKFK
jgi:hypothetical protein